MMKLMKQHLAELAVSFLSRLNSAADCSPHFFLLMRMVGLKQKQIRLQLPRCGCAEIQAGDLTKLAASLVS